MAVALKENRPVRGIEAVAERPDGTRVPFLPFPTPLHDASGTLVGAVNMLVDISERKLSDELAQRLASIVESSDDAIASKDLNGIITSWNKGAERLFGYLAEEVIGKPITNLVPLERRQEEDTIIRRIRRGERIDHYETVRRRKDGSLIDVSLTVSPVKNAEGRISGASKIARDITERKRSEAQIAMFAREAEHRAEALEEAVRERTQKLETEYEARKKAEEQQRSSNLRLNAALNNIGQGLCMFDSAARLVVCNERYIEMHHLPQDAVKPGCTLRELLALRKANKTFLGDPDEYAANLRAKIAAGNTFSTITETKDGRVIVVVNHPMEDGGWVAIHEDTTEHKRVEAEIARLLYHDALTGLPNRVAFKERLAEMFKGAASQGEQLAVLCVDLDRFTEVNDVFGHSLGDKVLREVSRRLQAAAGGAFLARVGNDQFTLIVTCLQPGTAEALAERLITAAAEEIEIEGRRLRISLTIGVALSPADGRDAETLSRNADAALYQAKAQERGSIRFFQVEMDERLRNRRALQHDLRSAVARGELVLHYQPQARIGGEVIGFEALVRWHHPNRGRLRPGTFIALAEGSGLIIPIGEWILREACRQAASWPPPLRIAINLSPSQFRHGDLAGLVHAVLLETGLPAGRLELEITETVLIEDFPRVVSILRRLKSMGVHIAMDDFGSGYSSLSYLQALPLDKIKIDQSFIANLDRHPRSVKIVRAVIGLGHSLDLSVAAEGVETEAQLAIVLQEGCDEVQGYLIGRPLPIENYAELVGRPLATTPNSRREA
jgi:diguanylate cyclase (GGDEF)-like protein/PAS domain S-box-containing protein